MVNKEGFMKLYKNAIILIIVVVVLFATYFVTKGRKDLDKSSQIKVLNLNSDNIVEINIDNKDLAGIDISSIYTGSTVTVIIKTSDTFSESVKSFVNNIHIRILRSYLTYEI